MRIPFVSRRREQRALLDAPFPDTWRTILQRDLHAWRHLDADERDALESMVQRLVVVKRWEAAQGFEVTDEMKVVVAAHAALLVLHRPDGDEAFRTVTSIVLHPTTITRHGEWAGPVPGVVDAGPDWLDGETEHRGAVHLAWDSVAVEARHPQWGINVVIHEFAHRLDMLDDLTDGTPPLASDDDRRRWVEVCTVEYERLRRAPDPDGLLRDYGATDVGEFFAVASEVFFTRGPDLAMHKQALYEVLRSFYGHETARWRPGT